jgi:hypothetical protein
VEEMELHAIAWSIEDMDSKYLNMDDMLLLGQLKTCIQKMGIDRWHAIAIMRLKTYI